MSNRTYNEDELNRLVENSSKISQNLEAISNDTTSYIIWSAGAEITLASGLRPTMCMRVRAVAGTVLICRGSAMICLGSTSGSCAQTSSVYSL